MFVENYTNMKIFIDNPKRAKFGKGSYHKKFETVKIVTVLDVNVAVIIYNIQSSLKM